jgi:hypothetical protein
LHQNQLILSFKKFQHYFILNIIYFQLIIYFRFLFAFILHQNQLILSFKKFQHYFILNIIYFQLIIYFRFHSQSE